MTYSSFGRRLGAYLIDFLLLSPLFALQYWAGGQSISIVVLVGVLGSVAFIVYRVYCHAIYGQTVGKRVVKLRVVASPAKPSVGVNLCFAARSKCCSRAW